MQSRYTRVAREVRYIQAHAEKARQAAVGMNWNAVQDHFRAILDTAREATKVASNPRKKHRAWAKYKRRK